METPEIYAANKLFKCYNLVGPRVKSTLQNKKLLSKTSPVNDVSILLGRLEEIVRHKSSPIGKSHLKAIRVAKKSRHPLCHQAYGAVARQCFQIIDALEIICREIVRAHDVAAEIRRIRQKIVQKFGVN